jgi:hypothetical protein
MIVLFNCKDFRKVTKVAEDFGPKSRASTSNLPKRASPFPGMRVLSEILFQLLSGEAS